MSSSKSFTRYTYNNSGSKYKIYSNQDGSIEDRMLISDSDKHIVAKSYNFSRTDGIVCNRKLSIFINNADIQVDHSVCHITEVIYSDDKRAITGSIVFGGVTFNNGNLVEAVLDLLSSYSYFNNGDPREYLVKGETIDKDIINKLVLLLKKVSLKLKDIQEQINKETAEVLYSGV